MLRRRSVQEFFFAFHFYSAGAWWLLPEVFLLLSSLRNFVNKDQPATRIIQPLIFDCCFDRFNEVIDFYHQFRWWFLPLLLFNRKNRRIVKGAWSFCIQESSEIFPKTQITMTDNCTTRHRLERYNRLYRGSCGAAATNGKEANPLILRYCICKPLWFPKLSIRTTPLLYPPI